MSFGQQLITRERDEFARIPVLPRTLRVLLFETAGLLINFNYNHLASTCLNLTSYSKTVDREFTRLIFSLTFGDRSPERMGAPLTKRGKFILAAFLKRPPHLLAAIWSNFDWGGKSLRKYIVNYNLR